MPPTLQPAVPVMTAWPLRHRENRPYSPLEAQNFTGRHLCMSRCLPSAPTHLARCTHGPIQGRPLLRLAKVGVVRVAAPQLLARVKGPELEESASS